MSMSLLCSQEYSDQSHKNWKNRKKTIDHIAEHFSVNKSGVRCSTSIIHRTEVYYFGIAEKAWLKTLDVCIRVKGPDSEQLDRI